MTWKKLSARDGGCGVTIESHYCGQLFCSVDFVCSYAQELGGEWVCVAMTMTMTSWSGMATRQV